MSKYCLRRNNGVEECRFKFPKTITHESKIVFTEKSRYKNIKGEEIAYGIVR